MESLFVFFSKFIPTLIYPVSLSCLFLLFSLIFNKKARVRKFCIIAAFLILFITGNTFPRAFMSHALEKSYPPLTGEEKADAIVVLGGCTVTKAEPRQMVEINSAGDRILYAVQLYKEGRSSYLLTGGSYIDWMDDGESTDDGMVSSPAREMADIAKNMGVPSDKILIQDKSLNTHEEAVEDAKILNKISAKKIILVTSAAHMKRSVGLFEKQGLDVIPAPTDYSFSDNEWNQFLTLKWEKLYTYILPNSGYIKSFESALKEYIGIFVYRLRGWM